MQNFLAQYGVAFGVCLLLAVSACAWLLARQATQSVARFRKEHHQRFTPRS